MAVKTKLTRIRAKIARCTGCHSCEIACAVAHSASKDLVTITATGERPGYRLSVQVSDDKVKLILCHHCVKPACMAACPTGAIYRHGENEPVLYDDEKCNSCFECVEACPFGAISVKPEGKKVLKCDLCIERLAQHKLPACVAACPTAALVYGDSEDSTREKRKEK